MFAPNTAEHLNTFLIPVCIHVKLITYELPNGGKIWQLCIINIIYMYMLIVVAERELTDNLHEGVSNIVIDIAYTHF